jgi:hypothetical protein
LHQRENDQSQNNGDFPCHAAAKAAQPTAV